MDHFINHVINNIVNDTIKYINNHFLTPHEPIDIFGTSICASFIFMVAISIGVYINDEYVENLIYKYIIQKIRYMIIYTILNIDSKYLLRFKTFIIKFFYNGGKCDRNIIKKYINLFKDINDIVIDDDNILDYLLDNKRIDIEIIKFILDKKINVNHDSLKKYINYPFRIYGGGMKMDIINLLINYGFDVHYINDGNNIFIDLCESKLMNIELLTLLIDKGVDVHFINENKNGLYYLIDNIDAYEDVIKYLVDNNENISKVNILNNMYNIRNTNYFDYIINKYITDKEYKLSYEDLINISRITTNKNIIEICIKNIDYNDIELIKKLFNKASKKFTKNEYYSTFIEILGYYILNYGYEEDNLFYVLTNFEMDSYKNIKNYHLKQNIKSVNHI